MGFQNIHLWDLNRSDPYQTFSSVSSLSPTGQTATLDLILISSGSFKTFEPLHQQSAYAKTKTQISSADQRLCFCHVGSTIPLLSKSKISSL